MAAEEVDPNEGTGRGMVAFLTMAIRKNDIVDATGSALRTGVRKVLETDEELESTKVQDYDVEEIIRRFRIRNRASMKDASLNEYEKRFRQVVDMYSKWLNDDPDWRPKARSSRPRAAKPAASNGTSNGNGRVKAAPASVNAGPVGMVESAPTPPVGMVTYPYPVRPGMLAQITLPEDLTSKEAERVAKFVASLAFEERLAITAGPSSQE